MLKLGSCVVKTAMVLGALVVASWLISIRHSADADEARGRSAGALHLAQAADSKMSAHKSRTESWAPSVKPRQKQSKPAEGKQASAAEKQAPAAADDQGVPAGQIQPQQHANSGGVTKCFDALARASSQAVDGEHQAFSFWDPQRPNDGTFRSIVALRYPHAVAPRGAAVIVNSPVDGACDATTLQVMPTLRSCSAIQGDLMRGGRAVANLTGLALIRTANDLQYLLLPTAGDGCAIIAIRAIRSP